MPKPERRGRIWEAHDSTGPVAYLITDFDSIDSPIAAVFFESGMAAEQREARRVAELIAAEPLAIVGLEVWDLRDFGRSESPHPTPACLYSWRLYQADPLYAYVDPVYCCPLCRFRLARMASQWCRQKYGDAAMEDYPGPMFLFPTGTGGNIGSGPSMDDAGISIDSAEIPL